MIAPTDTSKASAWKKYDASINTGHYGGRRQIYRYKEFEQYLASRKPGVEERARNWSMAIGLQDVDRLKPSESLLEQAMNINISYI